MNEYFAIFIYLLFLKIQESILKKNETPKRQIVIIKNNSNMTFIIYYGFSLQQPVGLFPQQGCGKNSFSDIKYNIIVNIEERLFDYNKIIILFIKNTPLTFLF